jgi:hypothetical protein
MLEMPLPNLALENARWASVGKFLDRHHPLAKVAALHVGVIGYYSENEIVDLVGRTSRAVTAHGSRVPSRLLRRNWLGYEHYHTDWVLAQKPDIIVFAAPSETLTLQESADYYATSHLLGALKQRRSPYVPFIPRIGTEEFSQMFIRRDYLATLSQLSF